MYPYCPAHIARPKEVKRLFLVALPERCYLSVRCLGEGVGFKRFKGAILRVTPARALLPVGASMTDLGRQCVGWEG